MSIVQVLVLSMLSIVLPGAVAAQDSSPATAREKQIAAMMLVDYGRAYGYQVMIARIARDRDQAQVDRDSQVLDQKKDLYQRKTIGLFEFELAQLRDAMNRAQLSASEKNLEHLQAEYDAISKIARNFAGEPTTTEEIYASFRRGWEAGCDKGPAEVAAARARLEYLEKLAGQSTQFYDQRYGSHPALLAQLDLTRSNLRNREAPVETCRTMLFPSLQDILQIGQ